MLAAAICPGGGKLVAVVVGILWRHSHRDRVVVLGLVVVYLGPSVMILSLLELLLPFIRLVSLGFIFMMGVRST